MLKWIIGFVAVFLERGVTLPILAMPRRRESHLDLSMARKDVLWLRSPS